MEPLGKIVWVQCFDGVLKSILYFRRQTHRNQIKKLRSKKTYSKIQEENNFRKIIFEKYFKRNGHDKKSLEQACY